MNTGRGAGGGADLIVVRGYRGAANPDLARRLSVSNGFLGVRGVRAPWSASLEAAPSDTLVAGLFAGAGEKAALAPLPDSLAVSLYIDGRPLIALSVDLEPLERRLDGDIAGVIATWSCARPHAAVHSIAAFETVSLADRTLHLRRLEMHVGSDVEIGVEAQWPCSATAPSWNQMEFELSAEDTGGTAFARATDLRLIVHGETIPARGALAIGLLEACSPIEAAALGVAAASMAVTSFESQHEPSRRRTSGRWPRRRATRRGRVVGP